ncbi:TasA family protein [Halobacillus naozhouensis]|uniref:TasA family protein n=1 Tax=Halobacillus naozhouensis TaxID=554880 RepID=A0ABY8IUN0_9BACI|nr:TasA family protein [Halobacillus naozhouensis]WFT73829.1 TasA family protein [Halobacillus naozhouensis]
MGIKKKLTNGALAATMGLALVGGGTFAAFNDVEAIDNTMATGTLELDLQDLNGEKEFSISNLKPGDHATRSFKMFNTGSLAIKDVLLSIDKFEFHDEAPGDSDMEDNHDELEYLDQFEVSVITVGAEGGSGGFPKNIVSSEDDITLKDIYEVSKGVSSAIGEIEAAVADGYVSEDGRINIATVNPSKWTGIPVVPKDPDNVKIKIEFVDDKTKDENEEYYVQNKFQGDSADVTFTLEARQWGGLDVKGSDVDENGFIETNEKANSEEGNPLRP